MSRWSFCAGMRGEAAWSRSLPMVNGGKRQRSFDKLRMTAKAPPQNGLREKPVTNVAGGSGEGFLAVRDHTEQWDFAEFWQDKDVGFFCEAVWTANGVVEHEAGDLQAVRFGLVDG